jgi:RNA 3'-terminal phosphate cyclase (ATP)
MLRSALTLSLLSNQPFHMTHIRSKRPNPGLAPQHLTGLLAAAQIGKASVEGGRLRSQEVVFEPGAGIQTGQFKFDVSEQSKGGSAGSVTLILQTILLPLLIGADPSQLRLRGGTHVLGSPAYDYMDGVFLETLRMLGAGVASSMQAWGFYPVGGGEIRIEIKPLLREGGTVGRLRPLKVHQSGDLISIIGRAIAANLPAHIAQRMTVRATKLLEGERLRSAIEPLRVRSKGPGAGIFLISRYRNGLAGFSSLGKKGKPSERVAEEAVDQLLTHHESQQPVDPYLADQLMLPLLLADGTSMYHTSRVTGHQQTNAALINLFYPGSVEIRDLESGFGEIIINPIETPP